MKIAVGIPVYNEEMFVKQSVQNCIDVGYDYVVYLDDGSTDHSYELLLEATKPYAHMKVLHRDENTVYTATGNRWQICAEECRKYNPDWIMSRATDECLPFNCFKDGRDLLRKKLQLLGGLGYNYIDFDYVDLWRSKLWYRVDGFWGTRHAVSCWKNKVGWSFNAPYGKIHVGGHRPTKLDVPIKECNINLHSPEKEIVVLHYGMSSKELLERKLRYQLDTVKRIGANAINVPLKVPPIKDWPHCNGYKIGYEFLIEFKKVEQRWFKDEIIDEPLPLITSFEDLLKEYDSSLAEEYDSLVKRIFYNKSLISGRKNNGRRRNR